MSFSKTKQTKPWICVVENQQEIVNPSPLRYENLPWFIKM
jgi:hypothetical protein